MLEELVEGATAIYTLLVVIGVFSEELLRLFPGFLLLHLQLHHRFLVSFVGALVSVLDSTLDEHDSVNFWVISQTLVKGNDDLA